MKSIFPNKKIPKIPPILENNTVVTNFKTNANTFHTFFARQCSILLNISKLPEQATSFPFSFCSTDFNENDLLNRIRSLNGSKSHGHDGISIRMIQLSCKSIAKPLYLLFRNCFEASTFPIEWKKANVIPVYKKGNKQEISNYRPISLLPIFSKIFERIIFNNICDYMHENKFFNPTQSSFCTGNFCVHQLISITYS